MALREQWFWLLPVAAGLSFFAYKSYTPNNTLDTHMTPQQEKASGVQKLTPKERKELQKWINQHHYPKPGATQGKTPTISEVLANGAYVRLSDNTLWYIHPKDRPITQSWITPARVEVAKSGDSQYPFLLINKQTNSKVHASPAHPGPTEQIPQQVPQTRQQPSKKGS